MSILLAAAFSAAAAAAPCRKEGTALPPVSLKVVASGFESPVHIANAGDGSGRLFVVEQAGRIKVLAKGGAVLKEPLLDIRRQVKSGGEMGLLSVAFHPNYKSNGRFFVNYTAKRGGLKTFVSEFKGGKETVWLTVDQPYSNHNGGQIAFGPDGALYVGMGDGGSGDDPQNHGQRRDSLLGKMLRFSVEGAPPAKPEIYALGLRNPWRFSFDPANGRLYAGDVGQDHWEEIDVIEEGGNYGWRVMEGFVCTPSRDPDCAAHPYFKRPIHAYPRAQGISVTGGFVYRGSALPELCGAYVFGDYGSGMVWALRHAPGRTGNTPSRLINDSGLALSSFGVGEDWELYAADHRGGAIYKLSP